MRCIRRVATTRTDSQRRRGNGRGQDSQSEKLIAVVERTGAQFQHQHEERLAKRIKRPDEKHQAPHQSKQVELIDISKPLELVQPSRWAHESNAIQSIEAKRRRVRDGYRHDRGAERG
jgi:hypothetical protein